MVVRPRRVRPCSARFPPCVRGPLGVVSRQWAKCRLGPTGRWGPIIVSGTQNRRRSGGPVRTRHGEHAPVHGGGRDRGTTFVEVLVSIVLLGTAVGGTLTALRTTIVSSERRRRSRPRRTPGCSRPRRRSTAPTTTPCSVTRRLRIDDRRTERRSSRFAPAAIGWTGATIDLASVQFWGRNRRQADLRHEGWHRPRLRSGSAIVQPSSSSSTCSARPATSADASRWSRGG